MAETGSGETERDQEVPVTAERDAWKAELMGYASKPYEELAIQARKSGMAEEDIQKVFDLGSEKMEGVAAEYDEWQGKLHAAIESVGQIMTDERSEPRGVLSGDLNNDSYLAARDKLFMFLGVRDLRPSDDDQKNNYDILNDPVIQQAITRGEGRRLPQTTKVSFHGQLTCPPINSPLGVDVAEGHKTSLTTAVVKRNEEGVEITSDEGRQLIVGLFEWNEETITVQKSLPAEVKES